MGTDQISRGTGENSRGLSMGKSLAALDGLNFFLADVQSGLGPFLGIYLLTVPGWNPGGIGLVLTIGGIVGLFAQTPAGALIDRTRHKRALIIIAALATSAGAYMITIKPSSYTVVTTAQVVIGVAGVVFPPAIASIALGLVGARTYTYRTGRMQAFNHVGNVLGAVSYGLIAYLIALRGAFWLAALTGILVVAVTLLINRNLINHDLARGLIPRDVGDAATPSGFSVGAALTPAARALRCRAALAARQRRDAADQRPETRVAPRRAGRAVPGRADHRRAAGDDPDGDPHRHPRRRVGPQENLSRRVRGATPPRGAVRPGQQPRWVIAIQILDGVGAGIFATLFTLVIADLTRGTGRFTLALGAATTVQGLGAALSTTLAGAVIVTGGFTLAFLVLAGVAVLALIVFTIGVPETAHT